MQPFDNSFPMLANRALDAVMPAYRELFARYGVTEQQWRVLRVIWTSENVTSARLSQRTLLSPPSLVNIIDRLEKKGLVTRIRNADDRRQTFIVASEKGRQLQQEVTPQVTEIQQLIQSFVSEEEWLALDVILSKITSGMRRVDELTLKAAQPANPSNSTGNPGNFNKVTPKGKDNVC